MMLLLKEIFVMERKKEFDFKLYNKISEHDVMTKVSGS